MPIRRKVIFLLSPESWGTSFVSKHHYAVELAKRGNRVFFINPPNQAGKNETYAVEAHPGVEVVSYQASMRGVQRLPGFLRYFFFKRDAKKIIALCGSKPDIVWSFDPFRLQDLRCFGEAFKIYHPVDPHEAKLEYLCAQSADIIFTVSDKLLELYKDYGKPNYQINHGLAKHFLEPPKPIEFEPKAGQLAVGYVGNLNYSLLDKDSIQRMIEENPKVHFYFIGPYKQSNLSSTTSFSAFWEEMQQQSHVHLLGPKPSAELPAYLAKMDILLMAYRTDINPLTVSNAHKVLEYLSAGKVIVSHFVHQYRHEKGLLEMASANRPLPELFKEVVNDLEAYNQAALQAKRRSFAAQNTYAQHLEQIEALIK